MTRRVWDVEEAAPFVRGSDTSAGAADRIESAAATLRAKVLRHLKENALGLTDEEMQERLDMNPSTERPRRIELVNAGDVKDSGQRRRTHSGRWAVVWVAV